MVVFWRRARVRVVRRFGGVEVEGVGERRWERGCCWE